MKSKKMWVLAVIAVLSQSVAGQVLAKTRVVMLGTGTPVPYPDRAGPAVAIVVDEKAYLFDLGFGLMRRAAYFAPRWGGEISALGPEQLDIAFITHLHSDHTGGFADFLLTGWTNQRDNSVDLYGPDGVQDLVEGTLIAFRDDIKYRLYGKEPTNDAGWRVNTHIVSEGMVYKDDRVSVIAFPVHHGSWPNAFGYRIETADKVIVYSGDLKPSEKLIEYGKNADLLIHEVICDAGYKKRSQARQDYQMDNHTSAVDLGVIANLLQPKMLILNHVLWFGCSEAEILAEVQQSFDGPAVIANDLDIY